MLIWAALAGALLLVEHLAFRDRRWRLTRPQSYVVGTATLGLCQTGWAMATANDQAAIAFWVIAAVGGAVVVGAYWIEGRLAVVQQDAQLSGMTAEMARGVAEEPIDGRDNDADPDA